MNVAELERVQPREMLPGQFAIRLGAVWIPEDLVQQFFREYLGDGHLTIQHSGGGNWHIRKGRGLSEENEVKHSAGGLAPLALLNRVLNGGSMTGRPSDDEEAARAVRVKAEEWRDAFEAWVLDDGARAARAADVYNRVMNNRTVRDFTGSRPSLAGLDPDFTPYDHQLAAAARMAHERCLVLSHVVGAGKTATLAIGMMAMRNTGQVDKPLAVVPNFLVEAWEKEVRRLFPAARILTLTSADLADGKRDRILQYVRANSFDMVIMSHSLFDSIPLSPEFYEFYNDEELRKLDAQILHERRREGKSISLKQLQERRQQHEEDLKAKAAAVRSPGKSSSTTSGSTSSPSTRRTSTRTSPSAPRSPVPVLRVPPRLSTSTRRWSGPAATSPRARSGVWRQRPRCPTPSVSCTPSSCWPPRSGCAHSASRSSTPSPPCTGAWSSGWR